ncbi:hypothetical protein B0H12DRAFT_1324969 [Mycena haematopus]|nr:hypothetical protein B0H12DRAFT_1324969 [Mycena haematopus]
MCTLLGSPRPLRCTCGSTALVPTPSCSHARSPSSHTPHRSHTRVTQPLRNANATAQPPPLSRTRGATALAPHVRMRPVTALTPAPSPLTHPPCHSHCRLFAAHPCAADVDAGMRCKHEHVRLRSDANTNAQSLCYALRNAGAADAPRPFRTRRVPPMWTLPHDAGTPAQCPPLGMALCNPKFAAVINCFCGSPTMVFNVGPPSEAERLGAFIHYNLTLLLGLHEYPSRLWFPSGAKGNVRPKRFYSGQLVLRPLPRNSLHYVLCEDKGIEADPDSPQIILRRPPTGVAAAMLAKIPRCGFLGAGTNLRPPTMWDRP